MGTLPFPPPPSSFHALVDSVPGTVTGTFFPTRKGPRNHWCVFSLAPTGAAGFLVLLVPKTPTSQAPASKPHLVREGLPPFFSPLVRSRKGRTPFLGRPNPDSSPSPIQIHKLKVPGLPPPLLPSLEKGNSGLSHFLLERNSFLSL